MNKTSNFESLKKVIERAYQEGVTVQEAEKYAAQTLLARMEIAENLRALDLDARMKKHGVKAVRGQAYLEEVGKHEKKPTESMLEASVNLNELVKAEETEYAVAEVNSDYAHALLDIFKDAHLYFRSIMKGTFE
jgi:pyruvate/2-oxoglutarate dehydrogenase complex dihydrolipoamide dehydrogenase (E3) component